MLTLRKLTDAVGAEVEGVDRSRLLDDDLPAQLLQALTAHGVLVIPGLHLDDETQIRFCRGLGPVDRLPGNVIPEISVISLDPAKTPAAESLRGTFDWHIDGTLDDIPHLAAVSTAVVITEADGGTEFANTAAAFASFPDEEQARLAELRVVHGHASHQRRVHPDPTPEQEARWAAFPTNEHPLVWWHADGRRSMLIGATAERIVGMEPDASTALLDDLLERATRPAFVYRHDWTEGDLVIWDNQALMHRACPYAFTSPRELHRTHVGGDTPPG